MLADRGIERLTALGAVLAVLAAFLPWATVDGSPVFGVDLAAGRTVLALAFGAGAAWQLARRGRRRVAGAVSLGAGIAIALVALARYDAGPGAGPGVLLAVVAAIALVHAGVQAVRSTRGPRPLGPLDDA